MWIKEVVPQIKTGPKDRNKYSVTLLQSWDIKAPVAITYSYQYIDKYICMCVCVCAYIYIYIYLYTPNVLSALHTTQGHHHPFLLWHITYHPIFDSLYSSLQQNIQHTLLLLLLLLLFDIVIIIIFEGIVNYYYYYYYYYYYTFWCKFY